MLVAGSMLLLLGVAAVVIDLSAGFVERNRDQGAADNAVMAGALDKAEFLTDQTVSASVLTFAKSNLRDRFGSGPNGPLWVELWRSCVDGDNPGWVPLPEPAAWAGVSTPTASTGSLDCISQTSSLLRVRIPDQLTETSFGKAIGAQSVSTNAVAIAKAELNSPVPPIVPFGISGEAGPGELCFSSAPTGGATPPCSGPSQGTFGTILSELWGDFYGVVDCRNATASGSISITTAVGLDHLIDVWPNPGGLISLGQPYPSNKNDVLDLQETNRDECTEDGGHAVPIDGLPLNTLNVDTGFPAGEVEQGLVSDSMFFGKKSRLQRWDDPSPSNPNRIVMSGGDICELDNSGPWYYLNNAAAGVSTYCDRATYTALLPTVPTDPPDPSGLGSKVERFNQCLAAYGSSTTAIFEAAIANSPRFVWAPQYWYTLPQGESYQPIHSFRMSYLGGVWFKFGPPTDIEEFYPDEDVAADICIPQGAGCKKLNLWQISAWYLPDSALPASVQNMLIGPANPRVPSLWE